jgi:hypothetical protein
MEGDEELNDEVAYGATLARLREVKSAYDTANIFRLNQNVLPLDAPLTAP